MKIAIGSDHGGFSLKESVKTFLLEQNYEVEDVGCDDLSSVDYPSYGVTVGEMVVNGDADFGIVICGTGIGISIATNKVKGVRCALVSDVFTAKLTRQHNDSNVLALGGRVIGVDLAIAIVDTWLNTKFEGDRHQRRIDLISAYERSCDE